MRSKTAFLIGLLVALHVLILCAGFVAPYDPATQNRDLPYAPPTRLHFADAAGFHLRPFVYAWMAVDDGYREDRTHAYPLYAVVRGDSYNFLGLRESNLHFFGVGDPGKVLLFGTDAFGRDEFSRILWGGQISI